MRNNVFKIKKNHTLNLNICNYMTPSSLIPFKTHKNRLWKSTLCYDKVQKVLKINALVLQFDNKLMLVLINLTKNNCVIYGIMVTCISRKLSPHLKT